MPGYLFFLNNFACKYEHNVKFKYSDKKIIESCEKFVECMYTIHENSIIISLVVKNNIYFIIDYLSMNT